VDLCHRLRQSGWTVVFTPAADVVHHLGRSMQQAPDRASLEYHRSHVLYYRKHNGPLATALLRSYLAAAAAAGWARSWVRPGRAGEAARRQQRDVLRVAWRGR
jgi:GT2 family glycosyltransferase